VDVDAPLTNGADADGENVCVKPVEGDVGPVGPDTPIPLVTVSNKP
jgi:hypothetical protein